MAFGSQRARSVVELWGQSHERRFPEVLLRRCGIGLTDQHPSPPPVSLVNRRMRNRTYGGVGGGRRIPAPYPMAGIPPVGRSVMPSVRGRASWRRDGISAATVAGTAMATAVRAGRGSASGRGRRDGADGSPGREARASCHRDRGHGRKGGRSAVPDGAAEASQDPQPAARPAATSSRGGWCGRPAALSARCPAGRWSNRAARPSEDGFEHLLPPRVFPLGLDAEAAWTGRAANTASASQPMALAEVRPAGDRPVLPCGEAAGGPSMAGSRATRLVVRGPCARILRG